MRIEMFLRNCTGYSAFGGVYIVAHVSDYLVFWHLVNPYDFQKLSTNAARAYSNLLGVAHDLKTFSYSSRLVQQKSSEKFYFEEFKFQWGGWRLFCYFFNNSTAASRFPCTHIYMDIRLMRGKIFKNFHKSHHKIDADIAEYRWGRGFARFVLCSIVDRWGLRWIVWLYCIM